MLPKSYFIKPTEGINNPRAKLTEDNVREIRKLLADGEKMAVVAKRFNVVESCIGKIKRGDAWGHVK